MSQIEIDAASQQRSTRSTLAALAGLAVAVLALIAVSMTTATAPNNYRVAEAQAIEIPATPILYSPGYQLAITPDNAPIIKTHSVMVDADDCEISLPGVTTAYTAVTESDRGACWVRIQRTMWREGAITGEWENLGTPPFEPTVGEIVIGLRGTNQLNLTAARFTFDTPLVSRVENREKITAYFTAQDRDVWVLDTGRLITE